VRAVKEKSDWNYLIGAFKYWVSEHYAASSLGHIGDWFYNGGGWKDGKGLHPEITTACLDLEENEQPSHWSLRFEHDDREVSFRRWRTDIGVKTIDEEVFEVATLVTHRMEEDFFGAAPASPSPTAPWFLSFLVSRPEWGVYVGEEEIRAEPAVVRESQDAKAFWQAVERTDRKIFAVAIADDRSNGNDLKVVEDERGCKELFSAGLNASELSKLLVGNAAICVLTNDAIHAFNSLDSVPNDYRLEPGMVRVYRPGLDTSAYNDSRRHRFFTSSKITSLGNDQVTDIIVESVARRSRNRSRDIFTSMEDLESVERLHRLAQLQKASDGSKSQTELLEEVELLNSLIEEKNSEIKEYEVLLEDQDDEIGEKEEEVRRLKGKIQYLESEKKRLGSNKARLKSQYLREISPLPTSVIDAVDRLRKLASDRVEFHDSAIKSARKASFRDGGVAFECLIDLATILYDGYFIEQSDNPSQYFNERSKFEVSVSAGAQTRKDSKLMKLRKLEYTHEDGEVELMDISPHLKVDASDEFLRVHYHAHNDLEKIIIGHCGDHLDTAGTNRRS
jgi:hypothetical protein